MCHCWNLAYDRVFNFLTTPAIGRWVRAGGESDNHIFERAKDNTIPWLAAWTTEMQIPVRANFIMHKDIKCSRDQFRWSSELGKGMAQVLVTAGIILMSVGQHLKHLKAARGH